MNWRAAGPALRAGVCDFRREASPSLPAKRMRGIFLLGLVWLGASLAAAADDPLAARVVLLANSADPDSLRVARHYAEARGVPAANIVALPLPLSETISWREFVVTLWQPLLAQLVRERWIDAIAMEAVDPVGRRKYAVDSHRIAALVACRGVPLKIAHEAELFAEALPFTAHPEFRVNAGAVDAELSLLAFPNYPINAFVPNPLFQNDRPTRYDLAQIVKVSRLDGPTVDDALALVDRALVAERQGLLGRAYVDVAQRDPVGDPWFENVATQLTALGFAPTVDRDPGTFPATARFDAPALYFGWYANDITGPFTLPGFQFPPGAIAFHLHSFSAATLRTTSRGWTAPFIARGVTATVGNVYEPYLMFSHRPNLLLRALARGANWVDAVYYSLQALSWQEVAIGDPLYRPFTVPLEEQLKNVAQLPAEFASYPILRRMDELDAAKRPADATALAVSAQHDAPTLAVGLALAQHLREAGDNEGAANALGFAPLIKSLRTDEWELMREAAQLLETCGRPTRALEVWRLLFAVKALPAELRAAWLKDALKTAAVARDAAQTAAWEKEVEQLGVPLEKK